MNSSLKMVIFLQVTSESFIDGGFFKTGDTVTVDEEGYFIILGRKYHFTRMHTYVFLLAIFITSWCYAWGEFWIVSSLIFSFLY
jgi:acyl-CoA synthetase (AMP-forming)/AMP-acid ligase II